MITNHEIQAQMVQQCYQQLQSCFEEMNKNKPINSEEEEEKKWKEINESIDQLNTFNRTIENNFPIAFVKLKNFSKQIPDEQLDQKIYQPQLFIMEKTKLQIGRNLFHMFIEIFIELILERIILLGDGEDNPG